MGTTHEVSAERPDELLGLLDARFEANAELASQEEGMRGCMWGVEAARARFSVDWRR